MSSWTITRDTTTGEILTGYSEDWVWRRNRDTEQVDPFEFDDELTFTGYGRGRSAATITFKGLKQEWHTGLDGLSQMIPHMVNGVIKGRFKFRKQGGQIYIFPVFTASNVKLTKKAWAMLARKMNAHSQLAARLWVKESDLGGLRYEFDFAEAMIAGDLIVEGPEKLYVNGLPSGHAGLRIDFLDTGHMDSRFIFNPLEPSGGCGCNTGTLMPPGAV